MTKDWLVGEVLKAVFPLLDGNDLSSCMLVCRQWRDIAKDDYFWKCICAKRWPSVCKRHMAPTRLIFSEAVSGKVLRTGIKNPPSGICDVLRAHLEGPNYKMIMPVDPRFNLPHSQTVISVLVGRKDTNKMACIVNQSLFDYVDGISFRALAYDYLNFSPVYPFVSGIRAWISLLFMANGIDGITDVFGIEIDFCDSASSEDEVLWLLDMLDWN